MAIVPPSVEEVLEEPRQPSLNSDQATVNRLLGAPPISGAAAE